MADESIRKDFYEGIYEVFSTLFTDGVSDGVRFYPQIEPLDKGVYNEKKYKHFSTPKLLVAKVSLSPQQGPEDIKGIKTQAEFTIPLKTLEDNDISMTDSNMGELRKGVIQYNSTFYRIDNILPLCFVENTFMMYKFQCTEDIMNKTILVETIEGDLIELKPQDVLEEL